MTDDGRMTLIDNDQIQGNIPGCLYESFFLPRCTVGLREGGVGGGGGCLNMGDQGLGLRHRGSGPTEYQGKGWGWRQDARRMRAALGRPNVDKSRGPGV